LKAQEQQSDESSTFENAPLPDPRNHHPRWLTPKYATIHLGSLRTLHVSVHQERIYGGVYAVRCLPVHFPNKFISLRFVDHDKREVEIGLIHDLVDWPEDARNHIKESLLRRYFVHTVNAVKSIKVLSGYLNVEVDTDLGPKDFIMRWQSKRPRITALPVKCSWIRKTTAISFPM